MAEQSGEMMQQNQAFPSTHHTWIEDRLAQGGAGLADVRRHVMEVYRWPLTVYVLGSSFRKVGEPEDLVIGFFASRLEREDYLKEWLDSGRPLRKWLMTGLRHYLFETIKADKRNAQIGSLQHDLSGIDASEGTSHAYECAVARTLVAEALRQTEADLLTDGLSLHWRVFHMHQIQGLAYARVEESMGIPSSRLTALNRTAMRRYRQVISRLVGWPGADDEEITDELRSLRDTIGNSDR